MSTTTDVAARLRPNTKQKVGLVLCGLYSIANIPFLPHDRRTRRDRPAPGDPRDRQHPWRDRPRRTVMAWRGNSVALRIAAGAIIVMTLTGLPAFFVDVPMWVKALVGVSVLLTVTAVVLMFSGDRRSTPVTD